MIFLNNVPIVPTIFPDGTSQVWKLDPNLLEPSPSNKIRWDFSHEGEFIQLAQLVMLLKHYGCNSTLEIKYLPYGRQDKEISNKTTFALHVFAKLLNTLDLKEVIIHDPHSEAALQLINNSQAIYPYAELDVIIAEIGTNMICFPDAGARSKYAKEYIVDCPFIYGEKKRNQLTGNIFNYILIGDPSNKNVLIVDDICDGGMTFKLLAKELLEKGANEVNLFVTHGIFSKGLKTLYESGINYIFTQNGEVSELKGEITYRRLAYHA